MIGGNGIPLPPPQALYPARIGGQPVLSATNEISLPAGSYLLIPAGNWLVNTGIVSSIQILDPVLGIWTPLSTTGGKAQEVGVNSDGTNFRVANLTGTPIGAVITNAGASYTTAPSVTPSAGASIWTAIVGGAINSTVTITTAGSGFSANYLPSVVVSAPPPGGVPCTMTATVSAGVINAVTVTNQGAGYTSVPTISVFPNPNDPNAGAVVAPVLTPTLTGAGTVTALLVSNPGTPLTAVPTLTFSPASTTAATVIMDFAVTGLTVTGGGVAVPAGSSGFIMPVNTAGASILVNPAIGTGLMEGRPALVQLSISGGVVQGTNNIFIDNGATQAVPAFGLISSTGVAPTTGVNITPLVGGVTDTIYITPLGATI